MRTNKHLIENFIEIPSNIILISGSRNPKHYIYVIKNVFYNNSDITTIELHGLGAEAITVLSIVVELITRLGYAEICKIKTTQSFISNGSKRTGKLIVHLNKTENFEKLYDDFQKQLDQRRAEF